MTNHFTQEEVTAIAKSVTRDGGYLDTLDLCNAAVDAKLAKVGEQTQGESTWRDHVEQRLLTWRQRFVNRSGDRLALDDFMDKESLNDLIDFVCDEYTHPQAGEPVVSQECSTNPIVSQNQVKLTDKASEPAPSTAGERLRQFEEYLDTNRMQVIGSLHHDLVILAAALLQSPAQPVGELTEAEIMALNKEHMLYQDGVTPSGLKRIIRAIEAAHKIGGRG